MRFAGYPHGCGPYHNGVDYHVEQDAEVLAVGDGKVIVNKYDAGGYGNYVAIGHELPDGEIVYSVYAHLASTFVAVDDEPELGDVIGLEGKSGAGSRESPSSSL